MSFTGSTGTRSLAAACAAAAALLAAPAARALEPAFTQEHASLALGPRYGSNDLNFGLGVHAGYTLETPIYVGGAFDYWFGESERIASFGGTISAETSGWNLLGLVGYDFGVTPRLVIRPYGGGGVFRGNGELCVNGVCNDVSDSEATGAIGGLIMGSFGALTLGGELRLIFADESAIWLGGNVGFVF